jgi:ATP-dependent Clp protease ATP-binding subunit ClpC
VLTTNVGSHIVAKGGGGGVGFELPSAPGEDPGAGRHARLRGLVLEELKAYFRPELLNRMDEVVVFRRLERPDLARIAGLELGKTRALCAARGVDLRLGPGVMDLVIEEGYSLEMGARELRRAVMRCIDDPLADALLAGAVAPGGVALARLAPGGGRVEVVCGAAAAAEAGALAAEVAEYTAA